jgi:hypothetical protein
MRKHNINADRFLSINAWLAARYARTDKHGRRWLDQYIGGRPSKYKRLEKAFFDRYVMHPQNWRG